jgi:hypothetical protein
MELKTIRSCTRRTGRKSKPLPAPIAMQMSAVVVFWTGLPIGREGCSGYETDDTNMRCSHQESEPYESTETVISLHFITCVQQ